MVENPGEPWRVGFEVWCSEAGCAAPMPFAAVEVVPLLVELRWRSVCSSGGDHWFIMADGTDSLCGDIRVERNAEPWQVQVAVDAAELLAGFDHPGGAPAQRHGAVLPVLHVYRVVAGDGDRRLDAVGRAQRAGQGRRHAQAQHGQRLGQALTQAAGRAGMGAL